MAGGLFVFSRFFGGGPMLERIGSSVASSMKSFAGPGGERSSLLRASVPAQVVTQNVAADRFRGMGGSAGGAGGAAKFGAM